MKLIIGLGNPDGKYKKTYHNLGFMTIDLFAASQKVKLSKNKCKAKIHIFDDFVLAEPQTYMNLSGDSVAELKKYFKVKNEDILVVLDDIDLPKGKIRFRQSGSAGTHNGLRDIIAKVGEVKRLRIGAGKPEDGQDLADYVLSNIDATSKPLIDVALNDALIVIDDFIMGKI